MTARTWSLGPDLGTRIWLRSAPRMPPSIARWLVLSSTVDNCPALSVGEGSMVSMTKSRQIRQDWVLEGEGRPPPGGVDDHPGQVFDMAARGVMEGDPAAACRLLGIPVESECVVLPSIFLVKVRRLEMDLLVKVGPGRLAHVEYLDRVRHGSGDADLITRMLGYRYVIMRDYPDFELTQHVLVLGPGRVRGHDELQRRGFALDLQVTYLSRMEPERVLAEPSLAPLASLAHGRRDDRAKAFAQAIAVSAASGGERAGDLIQFATMLATMHLAGDTIERIVEEARMTVQSFDEVAAIVGRTWLGRALHDEGRAEGRVQLLVALLQDRFGELTQIQAVADRLGSWADPMAAVRAVTSARSLEDLLDVAPAT